MSADEITMNVLLPFVGGALLVAVALLIAVTRKP